MPSSILDERARAYAAQAKAPATVAVYRADFARFEAWCADNDACALPAAPATVAAYLAWLADEGLRPSTIERALSGIGHAHREARASWSRSDPAIRDVVHGIRRRLGTAPLRKAPIMDSDLRAVLASLGDRLADRRDRAILALGWCAALRRSEIVALDVGDVTFTTEGMMITLRRSKSNAYGERELVGVPYAHDVALCAVRAVRGWLEGSRLTAGPLFRRIRAGRVGKGRLAASAVARILKLAVARIGRDAAVVGAHSLRAGFVTTAAMRGRSLESIMRQTRHRSERVARSYVRPVSVFADNPMAGLV